MPPPKNEMRSGVLVITMGSDFLRKIENVVSGVHPWQVDRLGKVNQATYS